MVGVIMVSVGLLGARDKSLREGQLLEGIWTVAPALILIRIAAPSLTLLYGIEES